MIKMKNVFNRKSNCKTILVLAECQQGALKAGRYAIKHLYDPQTRVILLRTFKSPKFGLTMIRNLPSILKDISKEDLTILKNTFIKEFGIPSDSIAKLAMEGDLTTIAQQEFRNCDNLLVVIGTDSTHLYSKNPYKQILSFMTITGIRPIFLIDDSITRIDRSKILVISENEDNMPERFKDFLINISERDNIPVEYLSSENYINASFPEGSTSNFSKEVEINNRWTD